LACGICFRLGVTSESIKDAISNGLRLLDDAKLLHEHARYASAYALSVLAMEELGKALLKTWVIPDKGRGYSHLTKQRAVASLLLAQFIEMEFGHEIKTGWEGNEDLIDRVAKALAESKAGKFSGHVDSAVIDKLKQIALYHDDWWASAGLSHKKFEKDSFEDMFAKCIKVFEAVQGPKWLSIGKALFNLAPYRGKTHNKKI
jgi:AbiV family abortive infection protein